MRRSKRKAQRAEERSGGNVIPLPRGRADASTAQEIRGPVREAATAEQLEPQPARAARSAEQLATHADIHHEDDHPDIRNFFADPAKSAPPASGQWSDLENTDHDITPPQQRHPRAMYWTAGIGGAGLLLIGAFLLYHKVLMPTPEELGATQVVALPTPDMVRSAPEARSAEPQTPPSRPSAAPEAPAAELPASAPSASPEGPSGSAAAPGSAASAAPGSGTGPGSEPNAEALPAGAVPAPAAASGSGNTAAPAGATSAVAPPSSGPSGAAGASKASTATGASGTASVRTARTPVPAAPVPAARGPASSAQPAPSAQSTKANPTSYDQALAEARKLGYRRSAEAAYLRALEANPKGAEALSGLAMLYLNFGDNARAKQRAEQALARDANSAEAWIVLGSAQSALGKHAEARQAYVRCAALPGNKYVNECKRMLH